MDKPPWQQALDTYTPTEQAALLKAVLLTRAKLWPLNGQLVPRADVRDYLRANTKGPVSPA